MTREEFIPRIQLPQIGAPPQPPATPEDEGSVRQSDAHHERFRRFLASGDGLDNLVDGVQRDTVGSDGRTANQREVEAEEAHHEAVMRRNAVSFPGPAPTKAGGFFDDDEPVDDDDHFTPAWEPLPAPDPEPLGPPTLPIADEPQGGSVAGSTTAPPQPDSDGLSGTSGLEVAPAGGPREDDARDGHDDGDGSGEGEPPVPDADDDDPVRPPGSLWDSTRGSSDNYDPGLVVVDPEPKRAEPGALTEWVRSQYQRRWIPLSTRYKLVAMVVVVVLTTWGGFLAFGRDDGDSPKTQAADPIVDTAPSSNAAAPAALPPDSVKAPGCAARSQPAANAFDGKPETAWVCVRAFNTDLQTITIVYSKPVVVTDIFVIPGFEHVDGNGRNEWNEHRVVTLISWRIGGQTFLQDIDPGAHTGSSIQIPNVATQVITGKIFKTVPPPPVEGDNGPSDEDINSTFAMSTITVNGYPAGGVPR